MSVEVYISDLGRIAYPEAWQEQERIFGENVKVKLENRKAELEERPVQGITSNHLLFCEHPHVYTLGKSGDISNLLVNDEELKALDAVFIPVNRGGDITYHGLGQMVVYPIFDLETYFYTDIHRFLRELEEVVILTLAEFKVHAGRVEGLTGVWVNTAEKGKERKICAMGIRCSRWITMHGLALNIDPDLSYFSNIIPCGINDKNVTSIKQETGQDITMETVKKVFCEKMSEIFGLSYTGQLIAE